jgi:hypothetical protein
VAYDAALVEVDSQTAATLRSATQTFEVTQANVTTVDLNVACTGAGGDIGPIPFQLAVDVQGPNGLVGTGTGSCGAGVLVQVPVTAMPASTTVPGSTETQARGNLPVDANATAAVGTWTVTITGSRGGAPSPLPVNPSDPGGTIVMNVEQWTARLTPIQR